MKYNYALFLLIPAALILVGCINNGSTTTNVTATTNPNIASSQVPQSALDKYAELAPNADFGASLERCIKGSETIYAVSASYGLSGGSFFYDQNGAEIGNSIVTDIPEDNIRSSIDLNEYTCTTLQETAGTETNNS